MAMREANTQPFAALAAAISASHVGLGPGFVDEDEPLGIEIRLRFEPVDPLLQDVWPALLAGVSRLFARDAMALEEPPDRPVTEAVALFGDRSK